MGSHTSRGWLRLEGSQAFSALRSLQPLWRVLILAAAIVLSLAACEGATTTTTTTDASDMVMVLPGEPIEVRALQASTGPASLLGIDQSRGIQLGLNDFGDVFGHTVNVEPVEDLCDPDSGAAAAEEILREPKVVAVIGSTCSDTAVSALPLLSSAGLVVISGSNTLI